MVGMGSVCVQAVMIAAQRWMRTGCHAVLCELSSGTCCHGYTSDRTRSAITGVPSSSERSYVKANRISFSNVALEIYFQFICCTLLD